jgi:hypothetical protein
MFSSSRKFLSYCWTFLFNHEVSSLRRIPNVAMLHYVLLALGLLWAISFVVVTESYTFLAVSVIDYTVLTAAAAITVATWAAASAKPELFLFGSAWQKQDSVEGQHKH